MPTVVLNLFAGKGTGRTNKAATICFPLLKSILITTISSVNIQCTRQTHMS